MGWILNERQTEGFQAMSTATRLITAEEYARLPNRDVPTELVRGRVVESKWTFPRHGQVCSEIVLSIGAYLDTCDLGHLVCNNAGVITERDPDSVRGADIWYVSYQKAPRGPLPDEYLSIAPDIVIEVVSTNDRWSDVYTRVGEFLNLGVPVVSVVDPRDETVRLYFPDDPEIILTSADELSFPNQLPGFSVLVQQLFE